MENLAHILFNPKKARRHPLEMILVGFFYTSLSIAASMWIFPNHASLSIIFLTVISCLYIVQGALILEEKKEGGNTSEEWLLQRHSRTVLFLLCLFIGFLIAFTLWQIVLPRTVNDIVYQLQSDELGGLRSISGNSITKGTFKIILLNNLKVLGVSIILALAYGAGALLILVWNASLMGFVIGSIVKYQFGFISFPLIAIKYSIHGIPEMIAYFIGALIGGIMYVTIVKGDFKKERIKRTIKDLSILLIIAITILIIAGIIETYISPLI